MITKGVDGVIINPNDPRGVSQAVQAVKKTDLPLVVVNSNLNPLLTKDAFCYVAENQVATGALAGKAIAEEVGKKYKRSETIKLAIIGGYRGDVISELRKSGYDGQMSTIKQMIDNPNGPIRAIASNQSWDQGVTAMNMIVAAVEGGEGSLS